MPRITIEHRVHIAGDGSGYEDEDGTTQITTSDHYADVGSFMGDETDGTEQSTTDRRRVYIDYPVSVDSDDIIIIGSTRWKIVKPPRFWGGEFGTTIPIERVN